MNIHLPVMFFTYLWLTWDKEIWFATYWNEFLQDESQWSIHLLTASQSQRSLQVSFVSATLQNQFLSEMKVLEAMKAEL